MTIGEAFDKYFNNNKRYEIKINNEVIDSLDGIEKFAKMYHITFTSCEFKGIDKMVLNTPKLSILGFTKKCVCPTYVEVNSEKFNDFTAIASKGLKKVKYSVNADYQYKNCIFTSSFQDSEIEEIDFKISRFTKRYTINLSNLDLSKIDLDSELCDFVTILINKKEIATPLTWDLSKSKELSGAKDCFDSGLFSFMQK